MNGVRPGKSAKNSNLDEVCVKCEMGLRLFFASSLKAVGGHLGVRIVDDSRKYHDHLIA